MSLKGFNSTLDLTIQRTISFPPELVWKALTTPELLVQWFCPEPWKVSDCRLDLIPGGEFFTEMTSPEGKAFPNQGCVLEVVEGKKFTWTSAMLPGFRPLAPAVEGETRIEMTAKIELEAVADGTLYTAHLLHGSEEQQKQHAAMGFEEGWGKAIEQMQALLITV